MKNSSPTIRYFTAVFIYGTIGYFLHFINARSEFVVLCRGVLGSLFILLVLLFSKRKINKKAIKNNFKLLALSGISLGLNWLFLFAGYKYSVSLSSLCNYTAPIIVLIVMNIYMKERLNTKQILCVIASFVGIVFVSGVFDANSVVDTRCIVYGLLAAIGFVVLVICNRNLKGIDSLEKTVVQLSFSALTIFPYVLANNSIPTSLDTRSILLLLLIGFVHTGVAYIFYFGSLSEISPLKIAVIGYVEPVLAVLVGAFLLKEPMTIYTVIGAVLIICSALVIELLSIKKKNIIIYPVFRIRH